MCYSFDVCGVVGHSIKLAAMVEYLRSKFPSTFVIAGNVSTPDAVRDLEVGALMRMGIHRWWMSMDLSCCRVLQSWGACAVKVGIGPGSACTTYSTTGFGSRGMQASVVQECALAATVPIVADGGIRQPGEPSKPRVERSRAWWR